MTTDNDAMTALAAAAREHQTAAADLAKIIAAQLPPLAVAEDAPPAEPVPRAPHPDWSQGANNGVASTDPGRIFASHLLAALYHPFAGRPE